VHGLDIARSIWTRWKWTRQILKSSLQRFIECRTSTDTDMLQTEFPRCLSVVIDPVSHRSR